MIDFFGSLFDRLLIKISAKDLMILPFFIFFFYLDPFFESLPPSAIGLNSKRIGPAPGQFPALLFRASLQVAMMNQELKECSRREVEGLKR